MDAVVKTVIIVCGDASTGAVLWDAESSGGTSEDSCAPGTVAFLSVDKLCADVTGEVCDVLVEV